MTLGILENLSTKRNVSFYFFYLPCIWDPQPTQANIRGSVQIIRFMLEFFQKRLFCFMIIVTFMKIFSCLRA
jgi:hypothetical protein